jgi:hydroxyacylglutathione hydrolase
MKVVPVPQLSDNYAYLVIDETSGVAGVVDCAEADSVLEAVESEGVDLVAILPTHHHFDHVGGNDDLLARLPDLTVYGYRGQADRIPGCTDEVGDGDTIRVGSLEARILYIPAHTSGHIAYHFATEDAVFTGDTLFAAGCGRNFEGDAAMMQASLAQARGAAARDPRLLRPRVHGGEPPLRRGRRARTTPPNCAPASRSMPAGPSPTSKPSPRPVR